MRNASIALSLATLLFAASQRALAQDPAEVIQQFKSQSQQALADFKSTTKFATNTLDAAFDFFSSRFEELAQNDAPVQDLAAALIDFQTTVAAAHSLATATVATSGAEAVAEVQTGGPDEDVLPHGLVVGDGGVLDDALSAINSAAAKAVVGPNKKLAKLAAKLRKKTDMRLLAVLAPLRARLFAPIGGDFAGGAQNTLTIDVVVGFDRGGADDDGRFWASGLGGPSEGDVSLVLDGASFLSLSDTPDGATSRWVLDNAWPANTLPEGNYGIFVSQNDGSGANATLGIR
jgi:hypothetical protein